MKIELFFLPPPSDDIYSLLIKDENLRKRFNEWDKPHFIDTDSLDFIKMIELTKNTSGFKFKPGGVSFNEKEIKNINFFSLRPKKILPESNSALNKNISYAESMPLVETIDKFKIRLIDKKFLTKINMKQEYIGSMELHDDLITTNYVKTIFEKEKIKGISFLPVYKPNGNEIIEGYVHLYGKNIMPAANINKSFYYEIKDDNYYFKILGCLAYDYTKVNESLDFLRTAEPIETHKTPMWIVSKRFKDCYVKNGLKGIAEFKPVLDINSDLYKEYIEKWDTVFKKVRENPMNQLG